MAVFDATDKYYSTSDALKIIKDLANFFDLPIDSSGYSIQINDTCRLAVRNGYNRILIYEKIGGTDKNFQSPDATYVRYIKTEKCKAIKMSQYRNTPPGSFSSTESLLVVTDGWNETTNTEFKNCICYLFGNYGDAVNSAVPRSVSLYGSTTSTSHNTSIVYLNYNSNVLIAAPMYSYASNLTTSNALIAMSSPGNNDDYCEVNLNGRPYFKCGPILLKDY